MIFKALIIYKLREAIFHKMIFVKRFGHSEMTKVLENPFLPVGLDIIVHHWNLTDSLMFLTTLIYSSSHQHIN